MGFQYIYGANSLEEIWNGLLGSSYYEVREMDSVIPKLDALDLSLIRELTVNGKVRPVNIAKYYDRDASTISRRITRLQSSVMARPVLQYDRRIFDITVPLLILGDSGGPEEITSFIPYLKQTCSHFDPSCVLRNLVSFKWLGFLPQLQGNMDISCGNDSRLSNSHFSTFPKNILGFIPFTI